MSDTAHVFFRMLAVMAVVVFGTAVAQEFELPRSSIDGGGSMNSTAGGFQLSGTIGQPDAGVLSGGGLTLAGGFWFEEPPGDCNSTGGVNLLDFGDLAACVSGPNGGLADPSCACFDLNTDDDVDLEDAGKFQRLFGGD